jgi:two-component system OmpR family sensor kinase
LSRIGQDQKDGEGMGPMTLRLRLVLALVILLSAGLALFGFTTYSVYAHTQYQRLDSQIRDAVPFVTHQLSEQAGLTASGAGPRPGGGGGGPPQGSGRGGPGAGGGSEGGGDGGGPPRGGPLATYAELRSASGTVLASVLLSNSTVQPKLPTRLQTASQGRPNFFTTGSTSGSESWRVLVTAASAPSTGDLVVIAAPTGVVTSALHRLVLVEVSGAGVLLVLLCAGAWLILRRGLRPLEKMAVTASSIATGDMSQRVSPAGGSGEVGQLGLALNTMLDEIETAFAERDATEQRLRQFLADASHELRTPLTSIQGFAELFRIGADQNHVDLPTILRRIEEESARMKVLVDDLLLLARLDETHPVQRAPVDLAVLAADACSDAVAAAPNRPVTLDAPQPVMVMGDRDHLRQAISNLVINAVRHTPDGTPIDVSARLQDGSALVAVRDHGRGLDDAALVHVFDRFWRAQEGRFGTGAGLGLSIVEGIAAEHGGTATAANADDGGAVFELHLPLNNA